VEHIIEMMGALEPTVYRTIAKIAVASGTINRCAPS